MPVLPNYTADQGLDFGRVPNVDIGAGYISQGMGKLASGLDQAAQGLQSYQQKQELAQKFDVNQIHSLTQEKIQTALQEYEKTAPANGVGFTEGFLKVAKPIQDEFLKQVPDNLKPQYLRQIQIDNQNILQTTTAKGDALRTTWDTSQINDNISKYETRVMGDPSQRDAALSDLKHSIDLAPSLTPQQKELAKKNVQATIEAAQAKGLYPDPQDMAKALGVPTAETRAAAQTKVPLIDGNATTTSRAQAAMSYLVGRGYSKVGAAGIVGNLVQESSLNPGSNNPHDGADGSDSIGVGQWNGARAAAFKQFAAAQGKPLNDLGVQLAFLDHELSTQYAGVKSKLMQATTPDEAAAIMVTGYEKPRGSEGGAVASDGWARRRDSARMLAGGTYNPADVKLDTSQPQGVPVGGDPRFANIPFDQRQTLVNWAATQQNQAQAIARGNLEPVVQDATAAYLTTGSYGGRTPTQQDFVRAYGPEQGGQKFIDFQKVQQIGQQVDQFKTMSADQINGAVAAAKPVGNGEGFSDAQSKYETLAKAAAATLEMRKSDPGRYVRSVYPAVDSLWNSANTADGYKAAIAATAAAEQKIGIASADMKLMPDDAAKARVDAFKNEGANMAQRVGAVTSAILSTPDHNQQRAIFQQLVKEGLPAESEGAIEAYARGDQGAGDRLMQAVMSDPSKIAGKTDIKESDILQSIQDNVMAPGKLGDIAYGVSLGDPANLKRAQDGSTLMQKAVKLRILGGETNVDTAVKKVAADMFGADTKVLSGSEDGVKLAVALPPQTDEKTFRTGVAAMKMQVIDAIRTTALADLEATAKGSASILAVGRAAIENQINNVLNQGEVRNYGDDGFVFINPYQNKPVSNAAGQPLVFHTQDILKMGTRGADGNLAPVAPVPGVVPNTAPTLAPPVTGAPKGRGPQPIPDFTKPLPATPGPMTSPADAIKGQIQQLRQDQAPEPEAVPGLFPGG